MRLYRHALESIFAMLELEDLSSTLAVSRSWSAAVRSMQPIGATIDYRFWALSEVRRSPPAIERLVSVPLMRHIATIECNGHPLSAQPTREALALLAQHAPNLATLDCSVLLAPSGPWILPAKLTSLRFRVSDSLSSPDTNALFLCVSALSAFKDLTLYLPMGYSVAGVDFSLLAASPSLTGFTFIYTDGRHPPFSDDQVNQIRTSLGHLQRFNVDWLNAETDLARFLRPPVTARWQDIGSVWLDAAAEPLLVTLPSLTRLALHFDEDRPHADFLSQLPQLKVLELWSEKPDGFSVSPAAMLNSLLLCTGITELSLYCGFTCAQMTVLFAKLTCLTRLTIDGNLESLQCFASGPITQTLEELFVSDLSLSPSDSELVHLYALRGLRTLHLDRCFSPRLDAATLDNLSPPTQLFPRLTEFICDWNTDDHECDSVVRKGHSFEWTQQRLGQ